MTTSATGQPPGHVELRSAYADSVTLLQVSRTLQGQPGVAAAQVAMATPLNLEVLDQMGFAVPAEATPNDMVVAIRLDPDASPDALAQALAALEAALAPVSPASGGGAHAAAPPRTTRAALAGAPAGSLAVVSVPGASALVEAMDALDTGHDVMVFSDNVPLDQERALKLAAAQRDLLVMGPDCGTAVVGGVGLGFANACAPGPVGIVAASGTGCQHLMTLLHQAGVGVTHALGVGGRDLSAEVAGASTRAALRRLDADPSVELIVLVSKPPAPQVAADLETYAAGLGTPVELALLGPGRPDLTAAAERVLARLGRPVPEWPVAGTAGPATGPVLRGLFVGGTLCDEAMLIATEALGPIHSNIPLADDDRLRLDGSLSADTHTMVDFGDDALTAGRAHPMIDPTLRTEQLGRVAADPRTGVILLDVVLGYGAEPDPAAGLAPAIAAARELRPVPVVVSVIGTDLDPQGLARQVDRLAAAGAEVHLSNARAARRAVQLIGASR